MRALIENNQNTEILTDPNVFTNQGESQRSYRFGWKNAALTADFIIPGDEARILRVQFDRAEMLRVLDEMPLSTEDETTPNEGLLPDHFAYIVEGAAFWKSQSAAFKTVHNQAKHYRLITGWTCLDIISNSEPTFAVVLVA